MPKRPVFQVDQFLDSQGIFVTDIDPATGVITTEDAEGQGQFDLQGFLSTHNVDPAKIAISLNSPTTAVARSPLTFDQRAALSAGNTRGSLNFLRDNFDDVAFTEDRGLSVLSDGIWQQVDPSFLGDKGDAWQRAKEFGTDIAEFGKDFLAKGAAIGTGASVGGAVGAGAGGIGAIPGAVVGAGAGAFAAETVESAIGKLVGTYDATPEEFLIDTTLESMLLAGGYAVPLGVRPTWLRTKQAFNNLSKNASPTFKNAMTEVAARTGQISQPTMERVLTERGSKMMGDLDSFIKQGAKVAETEAGLTNASTTRVIDLFKNARPSLNAQFGQAEKQLFATLPKNFRANMRPATEEMAASLRELGLIKLSTQEGTSKLSRINLLPKAELREAIGQQVSPFAILKVEKGLKSIADNANKILNQNGAADAQLVLKSRRAIDDLIFNSRVFADDEAAAVLRPIALQYRNSLAGTFARHSPEAGQAYSQMNALYAGHIDDVVRAERAILNRASGRPDRITAQNFTRKLDDPVQYDAEAGLIRSIGRLQGQQGAELGERALDAIAAREFARVAPRMGILQGTALASGGAIALGVPFGAVAPIAAGALAVSSPRLIGKAAAALGARQGGRIPIPRGGVQVPAGVKIPGGSAATSATTGSPSTDFSIRAIPRFRQIAAFMRTLSPEQRKAFIQDPAFATIIAQTLQDIDVDEIRAQQVLQEGI